MKKIIIAMLILIPGSLMSQNPDGRSASFHITPSWLWGKADFYRNTTYTYQSMAFLPVTPTMSDSGTRSYPPAFSIDLMLKIPTASYLTLSVSYSFNQLFEEDKEYYHYWSLNGKFHKLCFTASFYNLFSIY